MTTGYYLLDNRTDPTWYTTRRRPILAVVVHITAGLEDLQGADASAERTAAYAATTDRRVSWHSGSDADSYLKLLPATYTAWHASAYNSSTYGHEISKRDTSWSDEPAEWVTRTLANAAAMLQPLATAHDVPARRATRAELDAAVKHYDATGEARPVGFIAHADLDPTRRTDPGRDFPWTRFLSLIDDSTEARGMDVQQIKDALLSVLNANGTGGGQTSWAGTVDATLATAQSTFNHAKTAAAGVAKITAVQTAVSGLVTNLNGVAAMLREVRDGVAALRQQGVTSTIALDDASAEKVAALVDAKLAERLRD